MVTFLFHAPVTDFPVALWLTSLVFDVLGWWRPREVYRTMAQWLIGLGLVAAAAAIGTAFYDYTRLVREGVGTAFLQRHATHSLLAYAATATYLVRFLLRWKVPQARTAIGVLAVAGALLIGFTGYFGGELRKVM
ncbi:MAG: DUF2231 domain-containing protein [Armatimonadota bacterium]|nr:DUF2231 domain-containing protein [Armatimonadota bacterium]MDR7602619.1 DUF2231 domain-containing protein [Armatimonadota bacterium]